MNIPLTLSHMRPSEEWTLDGDDYAGLTWLSNTTKPTEKELETAYPLAIAAKESEAAAKVAARTASIEHAKGLGFTDEMIAVMYPTLLEA